MLTFSIHSLADSVATTTVAIRKAETRDASSSLNPNVGVKTARLDDFKINDLSNGSSGEINDEENVNPLRDVHTKTGIINAVRLDKGLTDLGNDTVTWPIAINIQRRSNCLRAMDSRRILSSTHDAVTVK